MKVFIAQCSTKQADESDVDFSKFHPRKEENASRGLAPGSYRSGRAMRCLIDMGMG